MPIAAESDIATALQAHLTAMPLAWPMAMPNKAFTPPSSGNYYRVSFQPNDVETVGLNAGGYRYQGLYLVTVITRTGIGELVAIREASRIAQHFDYLTRLQTPSGEIVISRLPSVRGGLVEGVSYEIPVVISYKLTTD